MLDKPTALRIAQSLIDAWNRHDMVSILDHYHEDIEFSHPFVILLVGKPDGTLRGKEAIKPYWSDVLRQIPHLRFKLHDVFLGVEGFVAHYQGLFERESMEVIRVDSQGKIISSKSYIDSLEMP